MSFGIKKTIEEYGITLIAFFYRRIFYDDINMEKHMMMKTLEFFLDNSAWKS